MAQDQTRGRTILVVDDFPEVRDMLKEFLTQDGYEVVEAANGVEAVEQASLTRPDLIIMDISMPLLNGIDAIREIRRDEMLSDVPAIIISAHGGLGIDLYAANADLLNENTEYIPKPIDYKLLTDALNRLAPPG